MLRCTNKHGAVITFATLIVLSVGGCSADSSTSADMQMAGLPLSAVGQATNAQALTDLRRITASLHDVDAAEAADYSLLVAPPLTAADGCISDMSAGGMGYHYSRFNNLGDNSIDLLDPESETYRGPNRLRRNRVNDECGGCKNEQQWCPRISRYTKRARNFR